MCKLSSWAWLVKSMSCRATVGGLSATFCRTPLRKRTGSSTSICTLPPSIFNFICFHSESKIQWKKLTVWCMLICCSQYFNFISFTLTDGLIDLIISLQMNKWIKPDFKIHYREAGVQNLKLSIICIDFVLTWILASVRPIFKASSSLEQEKCFIKNFVLHQCLTQKENLVRKHGV